MLLLALERSTSLGSVAVYRGAQCLYARQDPVRLLDGPDACAMVDAALSTLQLRPESIARFAIGLGPGSFSGIRSALALLQGLALPGKVPIVGVSSAAAVAQGAFRDGETRRIAVVGDARRGHVWLGVFERGGATLRACGEIALVPLEALAPRLPDDAVVMSTDWERLEGTLRAVVPADRLHGRTAVPGADAVAELALDADAPRCVPVLPIYLHPAVVARQPGEGNPAR